MVGTPRSRGCSTCRKRKKKCSEERPACLVCVKSGWKCPGYRRDWKFVDENQLLRRFYASKSYAFEYDGLAGDGATDSRIFLHEANRAHEIIPTEHGTLRIDISWPVAAAPSEKIGSLLCHILTDPASQHIFQLQSLGNFFQFVPSRLGHNAALDTSISCLCSIFTNILQDKGNMSARTLNRYGTSIHALQKCLRVQAMRSDPNTICASIILQLCELMTCQDNGRWNTLSRGSEALIRECGPERFRSAFERALLESQRAFFIVHNMAIGRSCFLAEPEWREVFESPDLSLTHTSRNTALRSELCDFLVDIPALISETAVFLSEGPPTFSSLEPHFEKQRLRLRQVTLDLSEQVKSWHGRNFGRLSGCTQAPPLGDVRKIITGDTKHSLNPEGTLFWVVNCVTNSVLVKLEQLLFALDSATGDVHDAKHLLRLEEYLKHEELARTALEAVGEHSQIATKPLIFGLSQLWSGGDVMATSWGQRFQSPLG